MLVRTVLKCERLLKKHTQFVKSTETFNSRFVFKNIKKQLKKHLAVGLDKIFETSRPKAEGTYLVKKCILLYIQFFKAKMHGGVNLMN